MVSTHHRGFGLLTLALLSPSCITYKLPDAPTPDPLAVYRAELPLDIAVRAVKHCLVEAGLALEEAASGAGTYVGQQSILMDQDKFEYTDYCDFGQFDFRPRPVEMIRRIVRVTVKEEPVDMVSIRVVARYIGTIDTAAIPEDLDLHRTISGSSTGAFERSLLEAIAAQCKDTAPKITVSGGAKPWKPRTTPSAYFPPVNPAPPATQTPPR